jgi:diguanylate cyclase (GGDEF)-like protein
MTFSPGARLGPYEIVAPIGLTQRGRPRLLCVPLMLLATHALAPLAEAARVIGNSNELPHMSVKAIETDERGFVWFGTEEGLSRSDGHRFLRIGLVLPGRMSDEYVGDLLSVPGAMYVVLRDSIVRVDTATLAISEVRTEKAPLARVNSIERMDSGRICGVQNEDALWCWVDREGAARDFVSFPLPETLKRSGVHALRARGQRLWLATPVGVYLWNEATMSFSQRELQMPELRGAGLAVTAIDEDASGTLWVGFWNHGILRIDLATGAERWFHPARAGAGALRATSVYELRARGDRVYFATNRGLVYFSRQCDCLRALSLPEWERADAQGVVVQTVAFERDGVWAGLWGGGAVRFAPLDEAFEFQVPAADRSDALRRPMVRALHMTAEGTLLVGTTGGAVQSVTAAGREAGRPWRFGALPWNAAASESRFIWHLAEYSGQLRIATGDGLFRYDGVRLAEIDPALKIKSWRSTLQTADGRIYAAGMAGLFLESGGRLRRLPLREASGKEFKSGIWSLVEHKNALWLATNDGLVRVTYDGAIVSQHRAGPEAVELPGGTVWALRRTRGGRLFAGTSGGLVEVEGEGASVRLERHEFGLAGATRAAVSIAEHEDQLWIGTPSGLVRYNPKTREAERFDRSDGLLSDQFTYNANAFDGERMHFGTVQGLVSFVPGRIRHSGRPLDLRVSRVRIGDGEWQTDPERVALPRLHAPVQIEVSAFEFGRPEQLRFAYRWRGEAEFVELRGAPTIVAERLDRGEHVLELRARREDSAEALVRAVLHVDVAPAWHERGAIRLLLAAALALLIYALAGFRSRFERHRAQVLEREVNARTIDLTRTAAALAEANQRLESLAELDPLTGLFNRRAMLARCEALTEARVPIAVMLIDLDRFKLVNDTHGHLVGDAVLRDFASVFKQVLDQEGRVLTRHGGEEFVAVLSGPDADKDIVTSVGDDLLDAVRGRAVDVAGVRIKYTVSIGMAVADGGAPADIEGLLHRADVAMYRAKAKGRNAVAVDWEAWHPQRRPARRSDDNPASTESDPDAVRSGTRTDPATRADALECASSTTPRALRDGNSGR